MIKDIERLVRVEQDVKYIKEEMTQINIKLDKMMDGYDKKYARKEIEMKVCDNEKELNKINLKIAKYIGIATGIIAVIQFIIQKLL